MVVKSLDRALDVEHPLITRTENPLELNSSDRLFLARSTKRFISAAMQRAGVQGVTEAERIIDSMNGWQIGIMLVFTVVMHFVEELPTSGWAKKRAKAKEERKATSVAAGTPALALPKATV